MRLFWHELRMQQMIFWRNRESAVFIFVFPPMLFLLLGAVYSGKIDGVPAVDRLLVGIMGYGCANTALAGLAIMLVVRRENGLLKRVRGTPLPAATYLAAVLVSTLFVFLLQMAVTVALGVTLYDARGAESWVALLPVLLLGAAAFAGLGIGLAALIRIGTPAELIGATPDVEIRYRESGRAVVLTTAEPTRVLAELTARAVAEGRELEGLEVRRPTLEDVYLDLVDEAAEDGT